MQIEVGCSFNNQNQRKQSKSMQLLFLVNMNCYELAMLFSVWVVVAHVFFFLLHPLTSSSMLFTIKFHKFPAFFSPQMVCCYEMCPHMHQMFQTDVKRPMLSDGQTRTSLATWSQPNYFLKTLTTLSLH